MVTGLYAALLALMFIGLSIYTITFRFKHKISLGDGGRDDLQKAVRAHGNFSEFVPIALILMLIIELNSVSPFTNAPLYLHGLGCLLIAGRVGHVLGTVGENPIMKARQLGMMATFATISIAAILLVIQYVRA